MVTLPVTLAGDTLIDGVPDAGLAVRDGGTRPGRTHGLEGGRRAAAVET